MNSFILLLVIIIVLFFDGWAFKLSCLLVLFVFYAAIFWMQCALARRKESRMQAEWKLKRSGTCPHCSAIMETLDVKGETLEWVGTEYASKTILQRQCSSLCMIKTFHCNSCGMHSVFIEFLGGDEISEWQLIDNAIRMENQLNRKKMPKTAQNYSHINKGWIVSSMVALILVVAYGVIFEEAIYICICVAVVLGVISITINRKCPPA